MPPQRSDIGMSSIRSSLLIALLALFASGCSTNIAIEKTTIPKPVTATIPIVVALRIPAEFERFVHEEKVLGREDWTIDLGRSNAALFTQLFSHLFTDMIVLGPDDNAAEYTFDALIEPSIEGFEFSIPEQSQTDAFAVWIRYRLLIFDSAGNRFANWPVSAYGKSQKEGIGSSDSLKRAAVLAMRDAAALMVTQMERATGLSALADGPLDESLIKERQQQLADEEGLTEEDSARAIALTGLGGFQNDSGT